MSIRIVINSDFGGFSLSDAGIRRYLELSRPGQPYWEEPSEFQILGNTFWLVPPENRQKALEPGEWASLSLSERQEHNRRYSSENFYDRDLDRTDPILVQVVDEMGTAANGRCASLKIVEIPDGVEWHIDEYDGAESIHEDHRSWG